MLYHPMCLLHLYGSGICHIEAAGTWDDMASELVQELDRRTTVITQDISRGMYRLLAFLMMR